MARRDIIGIGGSAGSTAVLKRVLSDLRDPGLTVFVTTHLGAGKTQYLPEVLRRASTLPVEFARDGEPVRAGRVYLAPPDTHLLITRGGVRLGRGPRENLVRPSIDPMLRSLALTYGPRVIGVVITGALNDGAAGLAAVKECGGLAVVQDPEDAETPDMPQAALEAVDVDEIAAGAVMGALLQGLARSEAAAPPNCPDEVRLEVDIAAGGRSDSDRIRELADAAPLTCPHCHGVLSEVREGQPLRYRCQIGHAMTADALDTAQAERADEALRIALRVVEERAELVRRMAKDARRQGRTAVADLYEARQAEYARNAEVLRKAVLAGLAPMVENDGDVLEADSSPSAKRA